MYNRFYQKAASLGLAVCMMANTLFSSYAATGLSDVSEGMPESPDYIVACCDDGASVVIEGDLPEDAEAYIEEREPMRSFSANMSETRNSMPDMISAFFWTARNMSLRKK